MTGTGPPGSPALHRLRTHTSVPHTLCSPLAHRQRWLIRQVPALSWLSAHGASLRQCRWVGFVAPSPATETLALGCHPRIRGSEPLHRAPSSSLAQLQLAPAHLSPPSEPATQTRVRVHACAWHPGVRPAGPALEGPPHVSGSAHSCVQRGTQAAAVLTRRHAPARVRQRSGLLPTVPQPVLHAPGMTWLPVPAHPPPSSPSWPLTGAHSLPPSGSPGRALGPRGDRLS